MTKKANFLVLLVFSLFSFKAIAEISCAVDIHSWGDGYVANVSVTNTGESDVDGWNLALLFSAPPEVESYWGAEISETGSTLEVSNMSWNALLKPGEAAHFGVIGAHSGSISEPTCGENTQETLLENYIKDNIRRYYATSLPPPSASSSSSTSSTSTSSTSTSSSSGVPAPVPTPAPTAAPPSAPDDGDITNTQEFGVDEADIVESDGKNLFVVRRTYEYQDFPIVEPTSVGSSSSTSSSSTTSSSSSGTVPVTTTPTPVPTPVSTTTPPPTLIPSPPPPPYFPGTYVSKTLIELSAYETDSSVASTELLSSTTIELPLTFGHLSGTYLRRGPDGNRLAILSSTWGGRGEVYNPYTYQPYYQYEKKVDIALVNVDDPSNVEPLEGISFDGQVVSSRRIDNMLYVVSRYTPGLSDIRYSNYEQVLNSLSLEDLLPSRYYADGTKEPLLGADDCAIPEITEQYNRYTGSIMVLTQVDLDNTDQVKSKCLPASVTNIYASQDAIYAFSYAYYTSMKIYKFAISEEEGAEYRGAISLNGRVACTEQSYCFGEKDGVLRVLYSSPDSIGVTPYQISLIKEAESGGLEVVSTIPNESRPESIGKPGERIFAMRSFGDYSYVVTFRQSDPLYAINLSDPEDPFIEGELEVDGFSSYLHPISDKYLLGIGMDAVQLPGSINGLLQGVKVELYDISDPTNLRVVDTRVIGRRGSNTAVRFEPRAFRLVSTDEGVRFALPISVSSVAPTYSDINDPRAYWGWDHTGLYVFGIEGMDGEAQFKDLGVVKSHQRGVDTSRGTNNLQDHRGILDGDAVYFLNNYEFYSSIIED